MSSRTSIQRRANEIDMDLARLVVWVDRLADDVPNSVRKYELRLGANSIARSRAIVRSLMHPDDVKDTGG